ncbi:transposase, partial [Listeria cornellensis]
MAIIHQPTLFDIEILLSLEPIERYNEIFSPLPLVKVVRLFDKATRKGRPISLNYEATFKALVIRYVEGIPTIKALVKRLNEDLVFKLNLGFLCSERVPSEASFSRFTQVLSQHADVLQTINHVLLEQIDAMNGLFSEQLAIDATHFSAHDKAHKTDNPKLPSVAEQLMMPSEDLMQVIPSNPTWSIKKNSKGKNMFWFGYKLHLAVSTTTQYIVGSLLSSAFVSDSSIAIPLLRKVTAIGSNPRYIMMDKG